MSFSKVTFWLVAATGNLLQSMSAALALAARVTMSRLVNFFICWFWVIAVKNESFFAFVTNKLKSFFAKFLVSSWRWGFHFLAEARS